MMTIPALLQHMLSLMYESDCVTWLGPATRMHSDAAALGDQCPLQYQPPISRDKDGCMYKYIYDVSGLHLI